MNREIDKDIDKGIAIYLVVLGHLSGGAIHILLFAICRFFSLLVDILPVVVYRDMRVKIS